jgi:predicted dienelactone hydrolase
MPLDYFERGPHPVGVMSREWTDTARRRSLPVEIWYPAHARHAGADLDPDRQDRFAVAGLSGSAGSLSVQSAVRDAQTDGRRRHLVLLVHGFSGHRRESSFMGVHLASHGFVVVAADHLGSTFPDIDAVVKSAAAAGRRFDRADIMPPLIQDRKGDVPFLLDRALGEFDCHPDRIGITGASFGGWTSLMAPSLDARIVASAPMCPSGGETPIYPDGRNHARAALDFRWKNPVPTLFMVADRDSWLPLYGQIELFRRTPGPKRMVIMERADHNHFVDDVAFGHEWLREFTLALAKTETPTGADWRAIARGMLPYEQLTPQEPALRCWRGLCAAHMAAHLRAEPEARAFWMKDVAAELDRRGVKATELMPRQSPPAERLAA